MEENPSEEILATKENALPTPHDRIFVAKVREYPYSEIVKSMDILSELSTLVDISEMVKYMKSVVPEFKSKNSEYEKFDAKS